MALVDLEMAFDYADWNKLFVNAKKYRFKDRWVMYNKCKDQITAIKIGEYEKEALITNECFLKLKSIFNFYIIFQRIKRVTIWTFIKMTVFNKCSLKN